MLIFPVILHEGLGEFLPRELRTLHWADKAQPEGGAEVPGIPRRDERGSGSFPGVSHVPKAAPCPCRSEEALPCTEATLNGPA